MPKKNTKLILCPTTKRAFDIINDANFNVDKGIIMNTGVNDIEHLPAMHSLKTKCISLILPQKFPPKRK